MSNKTNYIDFLNGDYYNNTTSRFLNNKSKADDRMIKSSCCVMLNENLLERLITSRSPKSPRKGKIS